MLSATSIRTLFRIRIPWNVLRFNQTWILPLAHVIFHGEFIQSTLVLLRARKLLLVRLWSMINWARQLRNLLSICVWLVFSKIASYGFGIVHLWLETLINVCLSFGLMVTGWSIFRFSFTYRRRDHFFHFVFFHFNNFCL